MSAEAKSRSHGTDPGGGGAGEPAGRRGEGARTLRADLEGRARAEGFTLFGVTDARSSDHVPHYRRWLKDERHGRMAYLAGEEAIARRADLRGTFEDVRSVVVVGHEYGSSADRGSEEDPSRAVIARYARGRDYHRVLEAKLAALLCWLDEVVPGGARGRPYVDTGPILERELGVRAGLGWFGRNTMLIDPARGSYFVLGVLLVDVELEPDEPFTEDRCGTCRACLDACPTGALLGRNDRGAPVMDARRCISYLTIENRGPIPAELRPAVGNRVFGCDICQEVCPWPRKFGADRNAGSEYAPRPELDGVGLVELTERVLEMSGKEYQRVFSDSPLSRPRRKGMLRNLCVGLGNWGATSVEAARAVRPVLERAVREPDPLVREHAEWGLGRLQGG